MHRWGVVSWSTCAQVGSSVLVHMCTKVVSMFGKMDMVMELATCNLWVSWAMQGDSLVLKEPRRLK